MQKHDLHSTAFPSLSEMEMAALGTCPLTVLKKYKVGEKLFELGDCDCNFFVVKSGEIAVVDEAGDTPQVIAVHRPGGFTGEIAQMTGSPALVEAVARCDSEVYELSPDAFRNLLNHQPDLGDMVLQAFITRRQLLREPDTFTGLRIIGSRYSQGTFRIREFLAKNLAPFTWLDLETNTDVSELLKRLGLEEADTPVVALGHKVLFAIPRTESWPMRWDFVNGWKRWSMTWLSWVLDRRDWRRRFMERPRDCAPWCSNRQRQVAKQAAACVSKITWAFRLESPAANWPNRATVQANKFGARLSIPSPAIGLTFDNLYSVLHLEGDETVMTRCLLIATGADYRLLQVEGCAKFEGRGVYDAATPLEGQMCAGTEVIVVGGGNSAGQAAVFLAGQVRKVHMLIRGDDLYKSMSSYLVHRIEQTVNIEVICNTEVRRMSGDGHLDAVEIVNRKSEESRTLLTSAPFSFIVQHHEPIGSPRRLKKTPRPLYEPGQA